MHFTKMHGCGNDYVVLDGRGLLLSREQRGNLAVRLCKRRFGIGADGLLIISEGTSADFEMEMYNPDGSRGESCGNGLRCAGKWLRDRGWTTKDCFCIETMGEIKQLERVREEGVWRVDMGCRTDERDRQAICLFGETVWPVCFGNPHAVLFPKEGEPGEWPVATLGPKIENAGEFPDRTNVEFVRVRSRSDVVMRVWERGAGETQACGTGACAAAAVCMQNNLTDDEITVKLLGGELLVTKDKLTGRFFLTGPAVTVCEGEVPD